MKEIIINTLLLVLITLPVLASDNVDKESIRLKIKNNLSSIMKCADLIKTKEKHGKISLSWDINKDGSVTNIQIKEAFNNQVAKCVSKNVSQLKFEKHNNSKGIISVRYPFVFRK